MNRSNGFFVRLTPKGKRVLAHVGGVAFIATTYRVEPAGIHEVGAVRFTNFPALPPAYSSKSIWVRIKLWFKQIWDNLFNPTKKSGRK